MEVSKRAETEEGPGFKSFEFLAYSNNKVTKLYIVCVCV